MFGIIHISDFESIKCGKVQNNPICFMVISLVNQALTCSLITMGRFKFMDNNLSTNNVANMNYNLIKRYKILLLKGSAT